MAELELKEIHRLHDTAFIANQTSRINAADDLLFSRVTQWDSTLIQNSQLGYRGQFDILRKAVRDIMADLRTNQVQIDFEPVAESRDADADLLNGLYLAADRENTSIEAYESAAQEAVDCGLGGWEIYTAYESAHDGSRNQKIHRRPIHEFNNTCFPDPNAKLLDKSDANFWSLLEPYSSDGYKKLVYELTGDVQPDMNPSSFSTPECSYVFPWVTSNELYYVVRFYHRQKETDYIITFADPFGGIVKYALSALTERGENQDLDLMADLKAQGFKELHRKKIKRWVVTLYIASGERILKTYRIPGEYIPVVPMYGERAFVEGEEIWEGVVRLAKDPQRLRNFVMSYLGDIVSRSPLEKPAYWPEQIAGFENMYNITGADNNLPYVYQNRLAADGTTLPLGPVATLPSTPMPATMEPLLALTRQAVEDVANSGLPKDLLDSDLSGEAIRRIEAKMDAQSQVYQDHKKHAKRYDAQVFASMAPSVYDSPRKVTLVLPDGSRKIEQIMQTVIDRESGEPVVVNDLTGMQFEVYAQLGPSYDSRQQKSYEMLGDMATRVAAVDPQMAKMLLTKQLTLVHGIDMRDIKDYANRQLILAGVKQPETDEEIEFAEQMANQPEQPSAEMLLAQGELLKGQAAVMKEQREAGNDQFDHSIDAKRLQLDAFNAETKRFDSQVKAQQIGANIKLTRAKIQGIHVQNVKTMIEPFRARVGV